MRFGFTKEQDAFRAALREMLVKEARSPDLRNHLTKMGAIELLEAEGDFVDAAIVFEEAGWAAASLPEIVGDEDRRALAAAAMLIGIGRRVVEMGAAYALERYQFGKPIGSFQGVKHRLADALLRVEFARPVVYAAACTLEPRDVSMAKALASDAAAFACRAALQVHGAIGYTEEHELHRWLKLGFALANRHGTAAWHRERVAKAVLDQP